MTTTQYPSARTHRAGRQWPDDLVRLFDEASASFATGAYTTSAMASRKILMACACKEGADDGKAFAYYVGYIVDKVLTFPRAKAAIDRIREIGNDANHSIEFVTRDDADRALLIVFYMLNAIYSLPGA